MARKSEEGLQYFPINTDIISNSKIKLVVAEFGPRTWAVLLPLLCKIYREKGYYIDWDNEDDKILFANDDCKCEISYVNEVVQGCVRRGFFDKTVFDALKILTSDRIQDNFLEAKKRSKEVRFWDDLALIDLNVYTNVLNVNGNPKKVNIGTQKKNRIKGEHTSANEDLRQQYQQVEKSKKAIIDFIRTKKPKTIFPFVDLWNIFAEERKKAKVKHITDSRIRKFTSRVNEEPFDFLSILSKAKDSEFLMTHSFFTFDWLVENSDNYLQVLEGKYDNDQSKKKEATKDQEKELMKSYGL